MRNPTLDRSEAAEHQPRSEHLRGDRRPAQKKAQPAARVA